MAHAGAVQTRESTVQLFGWDSRTSIWHGPDEVVCVKPRSIRLLKALRNTPGHSWYGALSSPLSRQHAEPFFALVHEFVDSAVAMIYCNDSKSGPAEILSVLPARRRNRLRPEFAFEFLSFVQFLGSVEKGSEIQVLDGMTGAIGQASDTDSLVFSIRSGLWSPDRALELSECAENLSTTLLTWLEER